MLNLLLHNRVDLFFSFVVILLQLLKDVSGWVLRRHMLFVDLFNVKGLLV